ERRASIVRIDVVDVLGEGRVIILSAAQSTRPRVVGADVGLPAKPLRKRRLKRVVVGTVDGAQRVDRVVTEVRPDLVQGAVAGRADKCWLVRVRIDAGAAGICRLHLSYPCTWRRLVDGDAAKQVRAVVTEIANV